MQFNKILHEAVVNADLSDKQVVKAMEPMIEKIRGVINSGLDRTYLEGESTWLKSAVDYFDREKLRPVIEIPKSDWMPPQSTSQNGLSISTDPEKILLLQPGKTRTIVQSSNIYEGVISPDGKKVAFFRRTDENSQAEIWVVNLAKLKRKKVAVLPSCSTLLFSIDGGRIFMQEKPSSPKEESAVWSVSAGGGKPKKLGQAKLLQTLAIKGKYKGSLIVFKNTIHHLGTTQEDCAHAWKESGDEIGKLKEGPCQ